jgi:hypothetical protein
MPKSALPIWSHVSVNISSESDAITGSLSSPREGYPMIRICRSLYRQMFLSQKRSNVPVAKAIQVFKANSSYWLRENGMEFAWQEGYGRSASAVPLATPSKTRLRIKRNTIRSELTNENSKRWYGNLEWRLSRRMRLGRMPSLRGLGLLQAFPALPCRAFTFRTFAPIY